MEFKVGDNVKVIENTCGHGIAIGTIITLVGRSGKDWTHNLSTTYITSKEIQLLDNENNMTIKEKFALAFLKEPEKSFRKIGITGTDGVLTTEGIVIFLTWLLNKNGVDFKKDVVDPILELEEDK